MALQAQQALDVTTLDVVADRGYYDAQNIKQCLDAGMTTYVAKPPTSRNGPQDASRKTRLSMMPRPTPIRVPAGQRLPFRYESLEKGRQKRHYKHSAGLPGLQAESAVYRERRWTSHSRWIDEHLLEAMRDGCTPSRR